MSGYNFENYKKKLNKYQELQKQKQEKIDTLLKEKHEKEEAERIRLENETKKQKLEKLKIEKEALEKEIQDEKDRKKRIADRIKFIKETYKIKDIEKLVNDLKDKLSVFDEKYRDIALKSNLSKEFDEINEIYKVLQADDKNKRINRIIKGILDKPKPKSKVEEVEEK